MKDQIYDCHFNKKFEDRQPDDFQRSFNLTIHAVGTSVERAIHTLGRSLKWGKIANIEWQPIDTPCQWYIRFEAGGTSMKASGEYVTGGVIVTWWK
jgi:hypothetical protein